MTLDAETVAKTNDWLEQVLKIYDRIGVLAQIVVAIVAVFMAYKANLLSRDSAFKERIIAELFEVIRMARNVRVLYARMFEKFTRVEDKRRARETWVQEREQVAERLAELQAIFPEIKPVTPTWDDVEEIEDTHTTNDNILNLADVNAAATARKQYEIKHRAFVVAVSNQINRLRYGSSAKSG